MCIFKVASSTNVEDDAASVISSEAREAEPEGEETETAPEGEGDDEDSVTRCIWWVGGYSCNYIINVFPVSYVIYNLIFMYIKY